jgi:predicted small secreted protein
MSPYPILKPTNNFQMKYALNFLMFLLCSVFLAACTSVSGVGEWVTENRDLSGFTKVEHSISGDVVIVPGDHFSLTIRAQKNILDLLETTVDHGTLEIRFKPNIMIANHKKITVHITMPKIEELVLTGSGNMRVEQTLNIESLDVALTGSGSVELNKLATGMLDAELTGSGTIHVLSGHATVQKLDIQGSGNINTKDMESHKAEVAVAGSGDARLNAQESLKVTITGSGDVYYSGKPQIESHISGSGDLNTL